jgi:hypothetical protein
MGKRPLFVALPTTEGRVGVKVTRLAPRMAQRTGEAEGCGQALEGRVARTREYSDAVTDGVGPAARRP